MGVGWVYPEAKHARCGHGVGQETGKRGPGPERLDKCLDARAQVMCVYGPAKTVADYSRLRNRLGIDVAVSALRTGLEEYKLTPAQVMQAAAICRVARIVRPYLEALAVVFAFHRPFDNNDSGRLRGRKQGES